MKTKPMYESPAIRFACVNTRERIMAVSLPENLVGMEEEEEEEWNDNDF